MTIRPFFALVALLLVVVAPLDASGTTHSDFARILDHYEAIRSSLAADSLDGVAEKGRHLDDILDRLQAAWDPRRAAVEDEGAESVRALLPEMSTAAAALTTATSLDDARDAFYELSKPLVRWRKVATIETPDVAYCSMARRSWLQPEGELGNPYYGSSMPTCGEFVDD